jgi:hypothetical protein
MDTHLHIHFDANGADISKYMHSVNTAYVRYYNKKYRRHGHVFQKRFESKILDTDAYNLAVSAYIHNNPKDIEGYWDKEELYKYSSYGIYLGLRQDEYDLVNKSFILGLFGTNGSKSFRKKYWEFVTRQRDIGCLKSSIDNIKTTWENEYRSERQIIVRSKMPEKVIGYILKKLSQTQDVKVIHYEKDIRAFCVYVLRILCGLNYKQICEYICNVTVSTCSNLCRRGYELLQKGEVFNVTFNEILTS